MSMHQGAARSEWPASAASQAADDDNRRHDKRFEVGRGFARVRCKEFEVAGAIARVLPSGLLGWIFRMRSSTCEVINLSKGGLAIETPMKLGRGRHVTLQLQLPDSIESLTLSGTVRWEKQDAHSRYCTIGIQFAPFSSREGDNPRAALETLRDIEARYAD
jgi:Tfp pilus assembly protein PilZ